MTRAQLEHIIRAATTVADGYYAQGVEPGTAIVPAGWESRVVVVTGPGTRGAKGLCLEVHDLLLSKYVAARDKDRRFCGVAIAEGLADPSMLLARLGELPVDAATRARIEQTIRHDATSAKP